jgi:hypothetical protein
MTKFAVLLAAAALSFGAHAAQPTTTALGGSQVQVHKAGAGHQHGQKMAKKANKRVKKVKQTA